MAIKVPTRKAKKPPPARVVGIWSVLCGKRYNFDDLLDGSDRTELTIGRERSNDIQVADPLVSGGHLSIRRKEGLYLLRDLESTNGTEIDQRPVTSEVLLKPGMHINIGASLLIVLGKDGKMRLHGRTVDSFLQHADEVYPSKRKAAAGVQRSRRTIGRALES